jgi:hypothetical protein
MSMSMVWSLETELVTCRGTDLVCSAGGRGGEAETDRDRNVGVGGHFADPGSGHGRDIPLIAMISRIPVGPSTSLQW